MTRAAHRAPCRRPRNRKTSTRIALPCDAVLFSFPILALNSFMKALRLLPFLALALAPVALPAADSYKIDPVHSSIMFRVHHWGAGHTWGRFNKFDGTVAFDAADPTKT